MCINIFIVNKCLIFVEESRRGMKATGIVGKYRSV